MQYSRHRFLFRTFITRFTWTEKFKNERSIKRSEVINFCLSKTGTRSSPCPQFLWFCLNINFDPNSFRDLESFTETDRNYIFQNSLKITHFKSSTQELKSSSLEESEGNQSIKIINYLKINKFYSWMERWKSKADQDKNLQES